MRFLSACFCWEEGRSKNFLNNRLQPDDDGGPELLLLTVVVLRLSFATGSALVLVEFSTGSTVSSVS